MESSKNIEVRTTTHGEAGQREIDAVQSGISHIKSCSDVWYGALCKQIDKIFVTEREDTEVTPMGVHYPIGEGRWISIASAELEKSAAWIAAILIRQITLADFVSEFGAKITSFRYKMLIYRSRAEADRLHWLLRLGAGGTYEEVKEVCQIIIGLMDEQAEDDRRRSEPIKILENPTATTLPEVIDKTDWHQPDDSNPIPREVYDNDTGEESEWDFDYAAAHIGIYFGWIVLRGGLAPDVTEDDDQSVLPVLIEKLNSQAITGVGILSYLSDGQFLTSALSENYREFTLAHYQDYCTRYEVVAKGYDMRKLAVHHQVFALMREELDKKFKKFLRGRDKGTK